MNGTGLSAAGAVVLVAVMLRLAEATRRKAMAAHRLSDRSMPTAEEPTTATPASPSGVPPAVASALADAGLTVDAGLAWRGWWMSLVLAIVLGGLVGGTGAAVVAAGTTAGAPVLAWRLLRRRSTDRLEAALPAAVDAIARSLRSGASLRQALAEAATATPGPLGHELASVARATSRGAGLASALEEWARRQPATGVRLVVSALCLGAETGGALARAVDGVAATLRQRLAARAEARALATQARTSAVVLAGAPIAFAFVASLADARTSAFLFGTRAGLLCLVAGLTLDAAGALWMARLTRIGAGS